MTPETKAYEEAQRQILESYMEVIRLKPGDTKYLIVVDSPIAFDLHWVDGTFPHYRENCPYCPRPVKVRFYFAAYAKFKTPQGDVRRRCLGELHPGNILDIGDQIRRGVVLKLSRKQKSESRLEAAIVQPEQELPTIPPPWDIRPVLFRIWGVPMVAPKPEPNPELLQFKKNRA